MPDRVARATYLLLASRSSSHFQSQGLVRRKNIRLWDQAAAVQLRQVFASIHLHRLLSLAKTDEHVEGDESKYKCKLGTVAQARSLACPFAAH